MSQQQDRRSTTPSQQQANSTPVRVRGSVVTCAICSKDASAGPHVLQSGGCNKPCHMICLVNGNKQKCGTPLKNNIKWLYKFMDCMHCRFFCENCNNSALTPVIHQVVSRDASGVMEDMRQKILAIENSTNRIQEILSLKLGVGGTEKSAFEATSTSATRLDSTKSPSYAQVISKELVDMVKMAVTESWKKQESTVHNETMLAVSCLAENGNYLNDIEKIFSTLNFSGRSVSYKESVVEMNAIMRSLV